MASKSKMEKACKDLPFISSAKEKEIMRLYKSHDGDVLTTAIFAECSEADVRKVVAKINEERRQRDLIYKEQLAKAVLPGWRN